MSGPRAGVSLPELMLAMALLALLSALCYQGLNLGSLVMASVNGAQDVSYEFARAHSRIERDLSVASFTSSRVADCPSSLGGAKDGQGICLLTPGNEKGDPPQKDGDGTAFFQRNILYYLSVPVGHSGCTAAADSQGYDEVCPHKVLVREVVDCLNATVPGGEEEKLMRSSDLPTFFFRPVMADLRSSYVDARVRSFEVVATQLVSMRVSKTPDPDVYGAVQFQLYAAKLGQKSGRLTIGVDRLKSSTLIEELRFSVYPQN